MKKSPTLTLRLATAACALGLLSLSTLSARADEGDDAPALPLGDPPVLEHKTPSGAVETGQRLVPFPFTPPDVHLKKKEPLSASNDWYTKKDRKKLDELAGLDFYAASGEASIGVVPKLHNSSAGIEIYELPEGMSKATFESTQGPFRAGKTGKFKNPRDGKKIAKFKFTLMAESGMAYFHVSRLLGHLVDVPPTAYRTMTVQELAKVGNQAKQTGNPSCTEAWADVRAMLAANKSRLVLPGGQLAYGALSQNPRGENSSPEDFWQIDRIAQHSFYKVLTSRSPVSSTLKLSDPKSLQDHALAQDLMRGVVLDSIFKQVDRLGNISTAKLKHYVDDEGKVKWDDKIKEKDQAEVASPIQELTRILYKDNDDGMNWSKTSVSISPILAASHHVDQTLYSRLQWLSGLMQDSEAGSSGRVRDYFVNVARISAANYDKMKDSIIEQTRALKSRVEKGDVLVDLDFEGTMKTLFAKKAEAVGQPQ
jgi:hypothetical protein